jgi:hypothetical protein
MDWPLLVIGAVLILGALYIGRMERPRSPLSQRAQDERVFGSFPSSPEERALGQRHMYRIVNARHLGAAVAGGCGVLLVLHGLGLL